MTRNSRFKTAAARYVKPLVGPSRWAQIKEWSGGSGSPAEAGSELYGRSLTNLALHLGTDKWGAHLYTWHYDRHLRHLRKRKFTLLEIGIGGYAHEGEDGASLRMWKYYFPQAQIIGLDMKDKSLVNEAASGPIAEARPTDPC